MVQQPQPEIKKVLELHIENHDVGLFSHLSWMLEALLYCEDLHSNISYAPSFSFTGGYAAKNDNWFRYYFDRWEGWDRYCQETEVRRGTNMVTVDIVNYGKKLNSFTQAKELFDKYIKIRYFVTELVDDFIEDNKMKPERTVAIHYRGTDKMNDGRGCAENDYLSPEDAFAAVMAAEGNTVPLFIATDDHKFQKVAYREIGLDQPFYEVGGRLGKGTLPVQKLNAGWQDGLDALVNVLVMARCKKLYKTSSAMSAWAKIFNPDLDVVMLNQLKLECPWFPERLLCTHFPEKLL